MYQNHAENYSMIEQNAKLLYANHTLIHKYLKIYSQNYRSNVMVELIFALHELIHL